MDDEHLSSDTKVNSNLSLLCLLPDDVSLVILSFLGMSDWNNLRLAQRSWQMFELTGHNCLWAPVFQSVADRVILESIEGSNVMELLNSESNYRVRLLCLKHMMAEIIEKRKQAILDVHPILSRCHKYFGLGAELDQFFRDERRHKIGELEIVVVGDRFIGKHCLLMRTSNDFYPEYNYYSSLMDFWVITNWRGSKQTIKFWHTNGSEEYDRLRPLCYSNSSLFLLCFSVVNPSSFQNITNKWLPEITHHCPKVPAMLVGTKIDLRSNVSTNTISKEEGADIKTVYCTLKPVHVQDTISVPSFIILWSSVP